MSRQLALVAGVLAVLALAGCGGSTGSHSSSSRASTKPTATSHPTSHAVAVDKSVVQSAPGGAKVRVTLVSYQANVPEPTGDPLAPKVFAITLRLQNLSSKPVKAHAPTYYSVLRQANTAGAETLAHAKGPCGGTFYQSRIRLGPHAAAQGCIPYTYGNSRPVTFGFGFGLKTSDWSVRSG